MDYSVIVEEIFEDVKSDFSKGKVADYIPALANVDPKKLGMAVSTIDGKTFLSGDALEVFSIQSISKVFSLTLALEIKGEALWEKLNKEPSGNPFNSLVQLEYEKGIPRNPFINAGALVISDIILSASRDGRKAKKKVLDFARKISQNERVQYDDSVAISEMEHKYRNAALANFMKSFDIIDNDIDELLDFYSYQCALAMNCKDLSKAFLYLANHGILPQTGEHILTKNEAKRINSLMLTCGLYDESGEFAFRVGLPGKSGVGGGIAAVIPNELSICVWSPKLNSSGNSLLGIKALELFTTRTGMSIF